MNQVGRVMEDDIGDRKSDAPQVDGSLLIISHVPVRRFAGNHYIQGGFGRHVDAFAERFSEVVLLTACSEVTERPDDYRLNAANVRVVSIRPFSSGPGRLRRYLSMGWSAAEAAVKLPRLVARAAVLHPRLPSAVGVVGGVYTRLVRKPAFFYMAGDWEAALVARADGCLVRTLARSIHQVFQWLVRDRLVFVAGVPLARKFGWPSEDVVPVNPTALGPQNILSVDRVVSRVRRLPRQVLFVGTIWKMKGVHVLLEAVRRLRAHDIDAQVRLIGMAEDGGAWLRGEIESRGLGDCATHTPHMSWNELLSEYEKADVFVMPSLQGRGETGPKVVLEAMARGLPVVASRVGFVPDVMRHMENGWIVQPGSVEEVVEALAELWTNRELRERFAANGIRTATEHNLDGFMNCVFEHLLSRYTELC